MPPAVFAAAGELRGSRGQEEPGPPPQAARAVLAVKRDGRFQEADESDRV